MITNFDKETAPLTEMEMKAANVIKAALKHGHVGEDKAVTSDVMVKGLSSMPEFRKPDGKPSLTTARIRKIINYLRTEERMMIVAGSKGYYVATEPSQIRDFLRSLYERCNAIKHVADVMKDEFKSLFATDSAAQMPL